MAQGLLTDKYLQGIPPDSRAAKPHGLLKPKDVTEDRIAMVRRLSELAGQRGQSMTQLALAWVLRHSEMTSVLIGASRVSHIEDAVGTLNNLTFTTHELQAIEKILVSESKKASRGGKKK